MAYAQTSFARFTQSGPTGRFSRIREILEGRAARRTAYRRMVAELQILSDSDLAELGYHRSEIPSIARHATRTA